MGVTLLLFAVIPVGWLEKTAEWLMSDNISKIKRGKALR
jgi:hypothetical protein